MFGREREREREVYRFHPEGEVVDEPTHDHEADVPADAGLDRVSSGPSEDGLDWGADADIEGDQSEWSRRSVWGRGGRGGRMVRPALATAAGLLVGVGAVSVGERLLGTTRAATHTPTAIGGAWGSGAAGASRTGQTTVPGGGAAAPKPAAGRLPARPVTSFEGQRGARPQGSAPAPEPAPVADPVRALPAGSSDGVALPAEASAVETVEAEFGFEE